MDDERTTFHQDIERYAQGLDGAKQCLDEYRQALQDHEEATARLAAAKALLEAQMIMWPLGGQEAPQTGRKADIIGIMAHEPDRVFTNAEIIAALRKLGDNASKRTLDSAVSRILKGLVKDGILQDHGFGKSQYLPPGIREARAVFDRVDPPESYKRAIGGYSDAVMKVLSGSPNLAFSPEQLVELVLPNGHSEQDRQTLRRAVALLEHNDEIKWSSDGWTLSDSIRPDLPLVASRP
ncbi:MAG: helix-turn-helix domain-containing protein [Gammaproteobacteria bacterium]|nr:helix-turn-helix domain-containing protein [Gammaproteobacteria bacterium]MDE0258615.1 helix-turn-helix domain-containing protein [Gammaproteobacteria bacterium]